VALTPPLGPRPQHDKAAIRINQAAHAGRTPAAAPGAGLAPERTIYITSASKCLAPGLRVVWVTAPRPQLQRLAEAARIITVTQPGLTGAVTTQ